MRVKADLNTDLLPAEHAEAIQRMVDEADFFQLPAVVAALNRGADRYQYNLTIENDGKRHSVEIHDTEALPESLKPLLKELTEIARSRPQS